MALTTRGDADGAREALVVRRAVWQNASCGLAMRAFGMHGAYTARASLPSRRPLEERRVATCARSALRTLPSRVPLRECDVESRRETGAKKQREEEEEEEEERPGAAAEK